jgi:hypothetical protein
LFRDEIEVIGNNLSLGHAAGRLQQSKGKGRYRTGHEEHLGFHYIFS